MPDAKVTTLQQSWDARAKAWATPPASNPALESVREVMARAYDTCAREYREACTPRPPQPEWFGDPEKEPGKWDAWWVRWADNVDGRILTGQAWPISKSAPVECVPISRTGFPCPVGWHVVEKRVP